MRFGTKRIASTADIKKAVLQVGLNEADRDVTRFLWVKDIKKPPVTTNLHVYRFTRVLYHFKPVFDRKYCEASL